MFLLFVFFYSSSWANTLAFFYTLKRYVAPIENKAFIECSFFVPGNVLSYVGNTQDGYQANILVSIEVLNNTNNRVYSYAYVLKSPLYYSENEALKDFSDLIKIPINEDSLYFKVNAFDVNDSTVYFEDELPILGLDPNAVQLSDIALISSIKEGNIENIYFKSGYIMQPKFLNYYPTEISNIGFYIEAYMPNQKEHFIKYFITDENNVLIGKYAAHKKLLNDTRDALYAEFNIKTLPSGNYYVYAELRDANNKKIDRKRMFFQRNNKETENLDQLDYHELEVVKNNFAKKYDDRNIRHHLEAVSVIASVTEKEDITTALNSSNLEFMQNQFYSFWKQRNKKNPEAAWKAFIPILKHVENTYNTAFLEGYKTDRGYVYLKYGKPLEVISRKHSNYGNIELWRYNNINGIGNIHFLFISNEQSKDDFQLVTSNLKGERIDMNWEKIIKQTIF